MRRLLPDGVQRAVFGLPTAYAASTPEECARCGWDCVQLDPARARTGALPAGPGAGHPALRSLRPGARTSPPTFVATIPGGSSLGRTGSIVTPQGALLLDVSAHFNLRAPGEHRAFTSYVFAPPRRRVKGRVAILATAGAGNYFHWMLESLPRLALLERAGMGIQSIDHFVVPRVKLPAMRQTLQLLGVPEGKLILADHLTNVVADQLLVPSLPGEIGFPTAESAAFLRGALVPHADRARRWPRRVLVVRRARRRFMNQDAVLALAQESGLEPVEMEGLHVSEQVALFAGATLIVAPHGAALTNLAFCAPGTPVVEIFAPSYVNPCYWALASEAGLRHSAVIGEGAPTAEAEDTWADIVAPVEAIRRAIADADAGARAHP